MLKNKNNFEIINSNFSEHPRNIQVTDALVKVLSIIVFFGLNFRFLDIFLFLKNFIA